MCQAVFCTWGGRREQSPCFLRNVLTTWETDKNTSRQVNTYVVHLIIQRCEGTQENEGTTGLSVCWYWYSYFK